MRITALAPVLLLAPALSAAAAAPAPGALKTFGDWAVGCDNTRRCTLASLGPEAGDIPRATMELVRAAGPDGGVAIRLAVEDDAAPATIAVDGRRFAVAPDGLSGRTTLAVATAIANGRTLALADARGRTLGRISLTGAAAAWRYVDAAQGRAGSTSAIVAGGNRPAATVPAAPPVPVVVALRPAGRAATIAPAQLAAMRRTARCDTPPVDPAIWSPDVAALGGGATLVILPCSMGAYNVIGALFVIRAGRAAPAQTDAPPGFEETGADSGTPVHSVVNGAFDGGLLTSYAKGRGIGDCGLTQAFAWDGARLRLVEQAEMRECRGTRALIPTWRARVVRR